MKNLLNLLTIGALVLITACSTDGVDSDQLIVIPERVEGTWDLVSFEVDKGTLTVTENNETTTTDFSMSGSDFSAFVTFTPHPYNFLTQGAFTGLMTSDTDRQEETEESIETYFGSGDWDINGDRLTKHLSDGRTINLIITQFDDDSMELTYSLDDTHMTEETITRKQGEATLQLTKRD